LKQLGSVLCDDGHECVESRAEIRGLLRAEGLFELFLGRLPIRRPLRQFFASGGGELQGFGAPVRSLADLDQPVAFERPDTAPECRTVHHEIGREALDGLRPVALQIGENAILRNPQACRREMAVVKLRDLPRRLPDRLAVAQGILIANSLFHACPCFIRTPIGVYAHVIRVGKAAGNEARMDRKTPMDRKTKMLLEGPIGVTLVRLAFPNILVMGAQAFVGLIETYFISELGTDALAGIAIVFPVFMLFQMISAGAMGGGILTAIARAIGSGQRDEANSLVWHSAILAVALGVLTSLALLPFGEPLYRLLGGTGDSLKAAILYGNFVFAGAILLWLFNSLAAVIRGTGNMVLPAAVVLGGVVALVPLSPLLIFGIGPMPKLGIIGGAAAVLIYYAIGSAIFAAYLWGGRGVLHPALRMPRLSWLKIADILRVGAPASIVATTTNLTIAIATASAGTFGPAAVAGYGTGARLEYLLIPLVFGLGAPVGAMVGTAVGARRFERAAKVAWFGAGVAGVLTEAIGLFAAFWPRLWLEIYGQDPLMLSFGESYLRIVGPCFGFFGFGLALYFAAQGTGRLIWPLVAGLTRLIVVGLGALIAMSVFHRPEGLYLTLALAMIVFCAINSFAVFSGLWLKHLRQGSPAPVEVELLPQSLDAA